MHYKNINPKLHCNSQTQIIQMWARLQPSVGTTPEVSKDGLGLEGGGDDTVSSSILEKRPACAEGACNINRCT